MYATTWRMKDKAWDIVTESLNWCSVTSRSQKALRPKYEDKKKLSDKNGPHNKMEPFKTGGRVCAMQNLTATEETIAEMMESTVDGQPSIWDSNNMPRVKHIPTIKDDKMDGINDENQEMRVDLTPPDAFENIEFL